MKVSVNEVGGHWSYLEARMEATRNVAVYCPSVVQMSEYLFYPN